MSLKLTEILFTMVLQHGGHPVVHMDPEVLNVERERYMWARPAQVEPIAIKETQPGLGGCRCGVCTSCRSHDVQLRAERSVWRPGHRAENCLITGLLRLS